MVSVLRHFSMQIVAITRLKYQFISKANHHIFWQAALEVHSTKRTYQSPQWKILKHVNCFLQGEIKANGLYKNY